MKTVFLCSVLGKVRERESLTDTKSFKVERLSAGPRSVMVAVFAGFELSSQSLMEG
jgi:hypothetical protein